MATMRWARIDVESAGDEQEFVIGLLSRYAPNFETSDALVTIYLPVDERLEALLLDVREALYETFGGREITVRFVAEEDWAHAWKQYFKPQRIGERFVVKPTWEAFSPAPGDLVIEIDPGMAFGTGLHATTRLCLRALERHVKSGDRIADVGTGSGILGVGALKLGASHADATDNDPLAVSIARENAAVNHLSDRLNAFESEVPPTGPYDIVVANILPDVLLDMRDGLKSATRPGGILILSGIIEPRVNDVRTGFEAIGLETLLVETEGEWVGITLRFPAPSP